MILLIYPLLCVVVGYVANQKGRSGIGWFLFSLLLSPLLGIIMVAIISSRKTSYSSLESQVRDSMLEARYANYIRSHKPAFSATVVHEVNFSGERRRFKNKADAIAYCMIHLPAEIQGPALPVVQSQRL